MISWYVLIGHGGATTSLVLAWALPRESWSEAIRRRRDLSTGGVEFVPFSIEAGGVPVWGPAARRFFKECIALANDDRDIDLYHWSSPKFSAAWQNTLSVLVARGRAQVSVAAAMADWPKRIRDMPVRSSERVRAVLAADCRSVKGYACACQD